MNNCSDSLLIAEVKRQMIRSIHGRVDQRSEIDRCFNTSVITFETFIKISTIFKLSINLSTISPKY